MATKQIGGVHNVKQAAISGAPSGEFASWFEEWSAAVIARTGDLPDPAEETESRLYRLMCNNNANTPGDAALKLRAILHSLYVSDAKSMFPDQCAALSTVVADLEQQAAAARFALRADAHSDFGKALAAFTAYDADYCSLPDDADDKAREQASVNRFDALAELMQAKLQTVRDATALMRIIVFEAADVLSDRGPLCEAIGAGLGNVRDTLGRIGGKAVRA